MRVVDQPHAVWIALEAIALRDVILLFHNEFDDLVDFIRGDAEGTRLSVISVAACVLLEVEADGLEIAVIAGQPFAYVGALPEGDHVARRRHRLATRLAVLNGIPDVVVEPIAIATQNQIEIWDPKRYSGRHLVLRRQHTSAWCRSPSCRSRLAA